MSNDELDAWFARADDVLRTWDGSDDAMAVGTADADLDPELPYLPGDRDVAFPLARRPTARSARPGPARRVVSSGATLVRRMLRRD